MSDRKQRWNRTLELRAEHLVAMCQGGWEHACVCRRVALANVPRGPRRTRRLCPRRFQRANWLSLHGRARYLARIDRKQKGRAA